MRDISFHPESGEWHGYVTKALDGFSEHIAEGSEKLLKSMAGVKPLYQLDGTFSGKGIRFDIPVSGARLSLYRAVEIETLDGNTYKGITVQREDGRVTAIEDTNTGTHREISVSYTHLDVYKRQYQAWKTNILPISLTRRQDCRYRWDDWTLAIVRPAHPLRWNRMHREAPMAERSLNYTVIPKHLRAIITLILKNIVLRQTNHWKGPPFMSGKILIFPR